MAISQQLRGRLHFVKPELAFRKIVRRTVTPINYEDFVSLGRARDCSTAPWVELAILRNELVAHAEASSEHGMPNAHNGSCCVTGIFQNAAL